MTDVSPWGPEVAADETLLRAITCPEWWDPDGRYLSSAAFGWPKVSVSVRSKVTDESVVLARFAPGTGLASFNCGKARELGFDAHEEPEHGLDDHAHLYSHQLSSSRRKKQARSLADAVTIFREPDNELLRAPRHH